MSNPWRWYLGIQPRFNKTGHQLDLLVLRVNYLGLDHNEYGLEVVVTQVGHDQVKLPTTQFKLASVYAEGSPEFETLANLDRPKYEEGRKLLTSYFEESLRRVRAASNGH